MCVTLSQLVRYLSNFILNIWLSDRALYSPERLVKIAEEAARKNSILSLEDRLGLMLDALEVAKAGYLKLSSALKLYEIFRSDGNCMRFISASRQSALADGVTTTDQMWKGIADGLTSISSTWFEQPDIISNLDAFRRVCRSYSLNWYP